MGPAAITQDPVAPGASFAYQFTVEPAGSVFGVAAAVAARRRRGRSADARDLELLAVALFLIVDPMARIPLANY